jgi:hypothetical protein
MTPPSSSSDCGSSPDSTDMQNHQMQHFAEQQRNDTKTVLCLLSDDLISRLEQRTRGVSISLCATAGTLLLPEEKRPLQSPLTMHREPNQSSVDWCLLSTAKSIIWPRPVRRLYPSSLPNATYLCWLSPRRCVIPPELYRRKSSCCRL